MLALVRAVAALPEQTDDLQRLPESLMPDSPGGESRADHVLVEPLAGADPEREAAVRDDGEGRRRLGDDGRVVAHGGAGDPGDQSDPLGLHRDRRQHRPGERAVPLGLQPRVVMVAHLDEVEAGLLGQHRLADELLRSEGLGGELVSDLHVCPPTVAGAVLVRRAFPSRLRQTRCDPGITARRGSPGSQRQVCPLSTGSRPDQLLSRRRKVTSSRISWIAAATGRAISAPTTPRTTPPRTMATMPPRGATFPVWPMMRGTSR